MDDIYSSFDRDKIASISPALLQTLLDALPYGIHVLVAVRENKHISHFEYLLSNRLAQSIMGVPLKQGKTFDFGVADLENSMKEVVDGKKGFKDVFTRIENGSTRWYDCRIVKFNDGVVIIQDDITSLRKLNKVDGKPTDGDGHDGHDGHDRHDGSGISHLLHREQKNKADLISDDAYFLNQILDTSPDIIFIMNLDTHQVIYTNKRIAIELGYTDEQVDRMKNPILDIMFEEDIPLMLEHLKKMKSLTGEGILQIEYRMKNAKGEPVWYLDRNAVFKRDAANVPIEKIGISKNINARKIQEDQINTTLDIIQQSEEIAGLGSWEYNIMTGEFKWSDGMFALFNIPKRDGIRPDIYLEFTQAEEANEVGAMVRKIDRTFEPFEQIITLYPKDLPKRTVRIKAIVNYDNNHKPVKVIGVDLDISQQVLDAEEIISLNNTLILKNKDLEKLNNELKMFNHVAARDYKDTIQILYTNLEYVISREGRHLSDGARSNIRRAQAAIQRMKLLTDDINSYLQLYEVEIKKEMVQPHELIEQAIIKFKQRVEQSNAIIKSPNLLPLQADPFLLSILLHNLLDNAMKFHRTGQDPNILIESRISDQLNNIGSVPENIPYYILSVTDNGIGFDEQDTKRIFDLFLRVHNDNYKGSGIGLAICRKIMEMHGGFIEAVGKTGEGAVIRCYFPVDSL